MTVLSPVSHPHLEEPPAAESLAVLLRDTREAQSTWADRGVLARVKLLRRLRGILAHNAETLARSTAELRARPWEESMTSEVLPLIEACRFLESNLVKLLGSSRLSRFSRPWWMSSVSTRVDRVPHGVVLVVGPANYPLFLPAVQALQAIAAGNAVLLKPAPDCSRPLQHFRGMLLEAGFPDGLIHILGESKSIVWESIQTGVDKVVLTGSASSGLEVSRMCAATLTPCTMELSGWDASIVRQDADMERAAAAIAFGLTLNGGATCIAPRRILVHRSVLGVFLESFRHHLTQRTSSLGSGVLSRSVASAVSSALAEGGALVFGSLSMERPQLPLVVLARSDHAELLHVEVFGPVAVVLAVDDDRHAVEVANSSSQALGASIFSNDVHSAERLADRLRAGVVTINDLILPTADPRIPFGGSRSSGHGVTRGAEGLLEMTRPKVVARTSAKNPRHLQPVPAGFGKFLSALLILLHACGLAARLSGLRQLVIASKNLKQHENQP